MKISLIKMKSILQLKTGKKVTVEQIVEKTGLSKQTLYDLDKRAFSSVYYASIEKICRGLGLEPSDIFEFDPPLEAS